MADQKSEAAFIVGLVVGACMGLAVGVSAMTYYWKAGAVNHNAGYYDAKTGNFKWNDEKGPTP